MSSMREVVSSDHVEANALGGPVSGRSTVFRTCKKCGEEYRLYHGKPGLITECFSCGTESESAIEKLVAAPIVCRDEDELDATDFAIVTEAKLRGAYASDSTWEPARD